MPELNTQDLLRVLGIGFIGAWVFVRAGYWKSWYWRFRGGPYAYLPLGVVFILYTYDEQAKASLGSSYFLYFGAIILLALVCLWWSLRPPAFVQPTWIRWIEQYPKRVREAMANDVKQNADWEKRVESKETVDAWARSLKLKMPKSR
jgi:hypothetical protein